MNLLESIKMAFSSLAINKLRSFLTMLGIIIGISAVITITTIGNSISKTLNNTFDQLGDVKLTIYPEIRDDYEGKYPDTDDDTLTLEKVQGLVEQHPNELTYSCNEAYGGADIVNLKGETFKALMIGVSGDYFDPPQFKKQIIQGRAPSNADNIGNKHTCLVSDIFCEQYFGSADDALGKTIRFEVNNQGNINLTIVGIMEYTDLEKSEMKINTTKNKLDIRTYVFFPYNTMLEAKGLSPKETILHSAQIGWTSSCDSETAKKYIEDYFEDIYRNNDTWQIAIYDSQEEMGMITTVLNVITIAISIIAAISLIVGGVGVMNIMLVSILERTREIGVRKALGALNGDIRSQFVIEAVIICLTGGTIGVLIGVLNGVLLSKVAALLLNNMAAEYAEYITLSVQPSIPAIIISLAFSMLTGLIFGYYPAKRAGNMNPIDALRYE
ncbi:ABC transporter permease [Ruminococcus albus]|uniref:Putative ABC transport system permease protein n=1 Tax=Ruminococcus albus TaxID=1264 RepID=A0A1H7FT99_RUMAL|nr:ABC transporter permease [Ruminococcus albus]SEK27420.1 putative ABC transport system permease protein [Ruminococcus albus]